MGFQLKRKTYLLDFKGTDLAGLEIRMQGMTTAEFIHLEELQEEGAKDSAKGLLLFQFLATKIVNWNLEDEDGEPIPVSGEALLQLEPGDIFMAMERYKEAVSGVPDPLEQTSPAGMRWEGEPIPMVAPSIPQPNLSTHV
jgi:hypothetical protein